MNASNFVRDLKSLKVDDAFNPYSERCDIFDMENAPEIRAATLEAMITAAMEIDVDALWIGRDLGHRGGRRTGLALTDDVHMKCHTERWGVQYIRPTKGIAVAERTASVIWDVLSAIEEHIFMWNVFPFHPFEAGEPFSNRAHTAKERKVGEEILDGLIKLLEPSRLVAIGNDAHKTALKLFTDDKVIKVRHPSYGGQTEYTSQINELYQLSELPVQARLI